MSQSHNADNEPQTGRPKRNIKRSRRAEDIADAGGYVRGLPSPEMANDKSFTRRATDSHPTYPSATPSSIDAMPAISRKASSVVSSHTSLPSFAPNIFALYKWQVPRPTDFLDLSGSIRAWKRRVDEQEKARDIDDGSDDWDEFSGDPGTYNHPHGHGTSAMEYCIANTFVHRAKRAFWAGKKWEEFEFQERSVDSEAKAKTESDPERRQIALTLALDNELRLAVFDVLKYRLCEEIWLEAYREPAGFVDIPVPRKDSKMPSLTTARSSQQAFLASTALEKEDGMTGWSIDQFGLAQPLYGEEKEPPNGMNSFMRDMRAQDRKEAKSMQPSSTVANRSTRYTGPERSRVGNVGVNGLVGMTAAEEVATRPLHFEDSDIDED